MKKSYIIFTFLASILFMCPHNDMSPAAHKYTLSYKKLSAEKTSFVGDEKGDDFIWGTAGNSQDEKSDPNPLISKRQSPYCVEFPKVKTLLFHLDLPPPDLA